MTRRRLHLFLSLLCSTTLVASTSKANEVSARAAAVSGLRIVDARQTLERYGHWDDGRLVLSLPGGLEFELITSIDDPQITNRGDGAFHAFEPEQVAAALADVKYPLEGVAADIYLLPYPRRGALESAAGPGVMLLSPGVRPLTAEHQQAEAIHELGHVVQYTLMPDRDIERWKVYRALRGIEDIDVYASSAPHADRPHEIFAEDFRALYGGSLATYSGSIENADLVMPALVSGLDPFLRQLAGASPDTPSGLIASAVAGRGHVEFRMRGDTSIDLELFDVGGRKLARLDGQAQSGMVVWRWDGHDAQGRVLPAGVVFARTRDGAGLARVTRLP